MFVQAFEQRFDLRRIFIGREHTADEERQGDDADRVGVAALIGTRNPAEAGMTIRSSRHNRSRPKFSFSRAGPNACSAITSRACGVTIAARRRGFQSPLRGCGG